MPLSLASSYLSTSERTDKSLQSPQSCLLLFIPFSGALLKCFEKLVIQRLFKLLKCFKANESDFLQCNCKAICLNPGVDSLTPKGDGSQFFTNFPGH